MCRPRGRLGYKLHMKLPSLVLLWLWKTKIKSDDQPGGNGREAILAELTMMVIRMSKTTL
jgi:hypothetical protein